MSDLNVVMLINAMFAGCSEEERVKLSALYQSAFSGTEYYKKLKALLDNCEFFGAEGADLYNRGKNASETGMKDATQFRASLDVMEYVIVNAEKAIAEATEYIVSYRCDHKVLSVIENNKAEIVKRLYANLASVVCYTAACLYGAQSISDFKFAEKAESLDFQQYTISQLVSLISKLKEAEKPRAWRIVRKRFAGANLMGYDGFAIEYLEIHDVKDRQKIFPYLYQPQEPNELCSGVGNIMNIGIDKGLELLTDKKIITSPKLNYLDDRVQLDYRNFDVNIMLEAFADDGIICIAPEEVVEILNRYFMISTAGERKAKGVCMYCGAASCNHFRIDRDFNDSMLPDGYRK